MDSKSLKKQLLILRDKAQFSIPLSFDGVIILVTELIALKISFGDDWRAISKAGANLDDLVKRANYLQETLHINTIEINRASKHAEVPEWLRNLLIFVDGIEINESNRKELADILVELLGENSREYIGFTKGLRVFLSNLLRGFNTANMLGIGASVTGVIMNLNESGSKTMLVQSGDDLVRLLFYIAGEEPELYAGSLFSDTSLLDLEQHAPYTGALISLPWNAKPFRGNDKSLQFARYLIEPSSMESLYMQAMLNWVDGRSIFILPPSFLFRTAGVDQQLKRFLVEENLIEAIIQLPESVMQGTTMPPVVLILNTKERSDDIYIADYSDSPAFGGRWRHEIDEDLLREIADKISNQSEAVNSKRINKDEIMRNDFNLSVQRYILSGDESRIKQMLKNAQTVPLGQIADIKRAQSVRSLSKDELEPVPVREFYEIMPSDIGCHGGIQDPKKVIDVEEHLLDRAQNQSLQTGDILLAIKGSVGKVGIISSDCGENWIAGQSFVIIRLKDETEIIKPEVLYRYLASQLSQTLTKSRVVGSGVKMIKMQDVSDMPVIIPSIEEQQEIMENNNEVKQLCQQVEDIKSHIDEKLGAFWSLDINTEYGAENGNGVTR